MTKVPLTGIEKENKQCAESIMERVNNVIASNRFILGPEVEQFEKSWALMNDAPYAVGVSNGTDALCLTLHALGIKPGDEVITVPNTFIATTEAIMRAGAKVKFVDVCPDTLLMDLECLEERITPQTKAIIPVHLHGQMVNMERLARIANPHSIRIIEDAAQAHLAQFNKYSPGMFSDAACYSFFPAKNLGAFGDAGAIVTHHVTLSNLLRKLRDHGRVDKYTYDVEGFSYRMDAVQAAVLNAKLPHVGEWNEQRRTAAKEYQEFLPAEVTYTKTDPSAKSAYHHFVIQCSDRDALAKFLATKGIETGIHYPLSLHQQQAYAKHDFARDTFPVSEQSAREKLSLPLFSGMTWEVMYVCKSIKDFYGGKKGVHETQV